MKPITSLTAIAAALACSLTAPAEIACQIGVLDLTANGGINPATGEAWKAGDKYHLIFVTTGATVATSTDIADYNTFVQNDAALQTGGFANMGSVSWRVLGSTTTTNAIDNAPITGPVMNAFDSLPVATGSADLWDFVFPNPNPLSDLTGANRNVWNGTSQGGVASSNALGAGTVRRHWTGWNNWNTAQGLDSNTTADRYLVGISEALVISGPDTSFQLTITPSATVPGGFDLEWQSQEGKLYNLRTSTDLNGAIATWEIAEADIEATPPINTLAVSPADARRFYAVEEFDAPPAEE